VTSTPKPPAAWAVERAEKCGTFWFYEIETIAHALEAAHREGREKGLEEAARLVCSASGECGFDLCNGVAIRALIGETK